MKITIEGTNYEMTRIQAREMLTANAFKIVNRVRIQGGTASLGIGAFAPKYRNMLTKQLRRAQIEKSIGKISDALKGQKNIRDLKDQKIIQGIKNQKIEK